MKKVLVVALVAFLIVPSARGIATALNAAKDFVGLGAVANGFLGTTTASANFALSGPLSGGAAAYSFKAIPQVNSQKQLLPTTQPFSIWSSDGSTVNGVCLMCTVAAGGCPNVLADATNPTYCNPTWLVGAASNCATTSFVSINMSGGQPRLTPGGFGSSYGIWFKTQQTTETRIQLGDLISRGSDDWTANTADFIYCNDSGANCNIAGGDVTTWYTFTNDNSGGGTQTNTGITVDTTWHHFFRVWNGTGIDFYIDGVKVTTHTTNLPSNAVFVQTPAVMGCSPTGSAGGIGYLQWTVGYSLPWSP